MPTPYETGRRKEYGLVKAAKAQGCEIAVRTAGSHSPFDIIAINITQKRIWLIQSKPDYISKAEKARLESENAKLNDTFETRFIVR